MYDVRALGRRIVCGFDENVSLGDLVCAYNELVEDSGARETLHGRIVGVGTYWLSCVASADPFDAKRILRVKECVCGLKEHGRRFIERWVEIADLPVILTL